jgi:hypothetical protein
MNSACRYAAQADESPSRAWTSRQLGPFLSLLNLRGMDEKEHCRRRQEASPCRGEYIFGNNRSNPCLLCWDQSALYRQWS